MASISIRFSNISKNHNNVLTDLVKHEHQKGFRNIVRSSGASVEAHIDMMAAVQAVS